MRFRLAAVLLGCAIVQGGAPLAQGRRSGLDVAAFDRSVGPQDDLFSHVNGGWLKRTAIPGDRVSYSAAARALPDRGGAVSEQGV